MTMIYQPKEVMEKLGFKDGVYKKYIKALEDEGYEFHKNDRGHRIFTEDDLKTLETFVELIQYDGMTIEKVAKEIGKIKGHSVTADSSHDVMALVDKAVEAALITQERRILEELSPPIKELQKSFDKEHERLKELSNKLEASEVARLRDSMEAKKMQNEILSAVQELAATKKKKWWRLGR